MSKQWGLPYQGSKARIAEEIVAIFPRAEHFYDLFGGGGAVTHCALHSGKFKHVHYNDLRPGLADAFSRAINGLPEEYCKQWVSRAEFFARRGTDYITDLVWSFGNNGETYLYAEEIEPYKKAFHYAAVFNDYSLFEVMDIHPPRSTKADTYERKLDIGRWVKANAAEVKAKYIKYWLSLVDEKKRAYEELYDYVLRDEDMSIKVERESERLRQYLLSALRASGLTQVEVGRRLGTQMQGHYFGRSQWAFPTFEEYKKMQIFMPLLTDDYYELTNYYSIIKRLQSLQSLQCLESLESLQRLQRLQRLQSLQSLQRLQRRLTTTEADYRSIKIEPNSVIYCDIPYRDTKGYFGVPEFDHDAFYQWVEQFNDVEGTFVFVSSYEMP